MKRSAQYEIIPCIALSGRLESIQSAKAERERERYMTLTNGSDKYNMVNQYFGGTIVGSMTHRCYSVIYGTARFQCNFPSCYCCCFRHPHDEGYQRSSYAQQRMAPSREGKLLI